MISSNSERKRFFIFDGYALLYRAHFALIKNPLVTSYGLHTSALYGFTNQVLKLIDKEKPDYVACAFDSKEKTFRHHMFNDYKAQRPEMPNELQSQLPHLWELLNFLNLPTLKKPGYEADDLIGTLAVEANKNKLDTYIVSGDKDFMQLINEHIFLYSPGTRWKPKATIYDSKGVEKKWGVKPNKIIDLLGLMGDASDNIPGASGIGEKTAVKLIKEYGSLENALKNAENIKNKRIQNGLQSNQDLTLLSKKLVTIKTDLNLELSVNDLKLKEINKNNSLKKFRELEFFALEKLISNSENDNLELKTKNNFKTVTSKDQLQKLVNHFKNSKKLTFSVEITSENPFSTSIIGFSFYSESKIGWYVPINHNKNNGNNFSSNNLDYILKNLKPVFENKNSLKVAHNVKFFSILLKNNSITLKGKYFDTQLAAHLINPESKNYSIDSLSIEYIGDELLSKDDILGKGRDKKTIDDISLQQISNYSLHNVEALFQLEKILKKKLTDLTLMDYYEEIELPMVTVLEFMELNGTYVDIDILSDMSKKNDKVLKDLKKKIYHISGSEFNLNSSQQLANILFDELKLPQVKKRSTAEDVLKILSSYNQIPAYIIKYRKKNKLKTTYFDSLPEFVNAETSRIHTTFNQTVAATGRLSSTNPNFQNIPIRSEEGKEIRKAFCSQKKNWKILSADYSQIELRIMAHMSKDKGLLNAFGNGLDIHSETASRIFKVPLELVSAEMRRTAKIVNFGIMYGAGPFRMSQELGVTRNEANEVIKSYFKQFVGIRDYIDQVIDQARNMNYVKTLLGRRRPVFEVNSSNGLRRKAAERMAINMPIQGSAAEMIKIAMKNIIDELDKKKMQSKMVLQIHDELIFEFPKNEESSLKKLVVDKMENVVELSVPLVVDYGVGNNWYEAH